MAKKVKSITYLEFAQWAKSLALGEKIEGYDADLFVGKAEKLAEREAKKSKTSKENSKPSESKAKPETIEMANAILSVLTETPMTAKEIFTALGYEYDTAQTGLQVSTAINYLMRTVKIAKSWKPEEVDKVKNGIKCKDTTTKRAYALAPEGEDAPEDTDPDSDTEE